MQTVVGTWTEVVENLRRLLERHRTSGYIGEDATQLDHALLTFVHALRAGAPCEVRVGAFLHDIGHLLTTEHLATVGMAPSASMRHPVDGSDLGVVSHERVGAEYLARLGFPPLTVAVVRQHVNAKRYLVLQRGASYQKKLSAASLATLGIQGGPMLPEEAADFEALEGHTWFVQMRLWEEAAKGQAPFLEDPRGEIVVDTRPSREQSFAAAVADCMSLDPSLTQQSAPS